MAGKTSANDILKAVSRSFEMRFDLLKCDGEDLDDNFTIVSCFDENLVGFTNAGLGEGWLAPALLCVPGHVLFEDSGFAW